MTTPAFARPLDLGPTTTPDDDDALSGLKRTGSITRGVLAGTNRDVAVESGLRVQVEGEVAKGVRVEAALSDENTPILAEGTTQRLSEFDKLYLNVTTKATEVRLGDVDLAVEGTELARLSRKVQGGQADVRFGQALGFALVVAALTFIAAALAAWIGPRGALTAAALSAVAELHAAVATLANQFARGGLEATEARGWMLALLAASLIAKSVIAWVSGGAAYGWRVSAGLMAALAAGAAMVVAF